MLFRSVGPMAAVHACLAGATGVDAQEVARMTLAYRWSFSEKGPDHGYGGPGCEVRTTRAQWTTADRDAALSAENMAGRVEALPGNPKRVAEIIRSWKDEEPRKLWERLKAEGWPSLMPVEGGRWLGPQKVEEVARMVWVYGRSFNTKGPDSGFLPSESSSGTRVWNAHPPQYYANAVAALPTFPPTAVWQGTAETLALPDDLSGWIIYCDPPYQGTTGYPHGDCPRETVLRLARDWSERGAVVAISEAVPLPLEGWHHVEIGHARKGQKRTFSKQQEEWLTMNRPPAHVPAKQVGLFGGDK